MNINRAQLISEGALAEARRLYTILRHDSLLDTHAQVVKENNTKALEEFGHLVDTGRYKGLKIWIKRYRERNLGEMNMTELKFMASSYGISKYYERTKIELIQLIRFRQERPLKCVICGERHPELVCKEKEDDE